MIPQKEAHTATTLLGRVIGMMSPYPTVVTVCRHQYQPFRLETKEVGEESMLYLREGKGGKGGLECDMRPEAKR